MKHKPGFTLLEVLVAISLLLFLMGFLVACGRDTFHRSRVSSTQALVHEIDMGLNRYYADFGHYPPDSGFGMPIGSSVSGSEVRYDSGTLWRNLSKPVIDDRNGFKRVRGPYVTFRAENLIEYNDATYGKSCYVVDVWGTPIGYRGDPRRALNNRGAADVFSAGPNKVTGSNDKCDNDGTGIDMPPDLAYDGIDNDGDGIVDNAPELGQGIWDGNLNELKRAKGDGKEVLDDISNWTLRQ